ncbi:hypothetical protein [Bifidobacterium castoris]|uniref:Uncharacterized protein n=1 Tax=Bifidobacterium castoris TaxID=2306972 RepID=A0A430F5C4_9BIFI|nr:hypothetical protein [Bifidobacterium castoris]RSX46127.1 hypothetical protein D2E22_1699 [Bifidobacterium castoris]
MTTITCDDAQRICFVTTDDARELAIPYQAVASWKALLNLGSYDEALDAIIDHTKPGADPIDWADKYEVLAGQDDPQPVAPRISLFAMPAAASQGRSALSGLEDVLAGLEQDFVNQVKQGGMR